MALPATPYFDTLLATVQANKLDINDSGELWINKSQALTEAFANALINDFVPTVQFLIGAGQILEAGDIYQYIDQQLNNNDEVIQQFEDKWFKGGSLKIGEPENHYTSNGNVSGYDYILNGYLTSGMTNFGDFSGKNIVSDANIWVHFPFQNNGSQMLAFTMRNYQFQGHEEKFKCNNYTINTNSFAHEDDVNRFKFHFHSAATLGNTDGKYYLSIFFPSTYYVSSQISVIKGRQAGVLTREQFGTPEFSLSDTPTGSTL